VIVRRYKGRARQPVGNIRPVLAGRCNRAGAYNQSFTDARWDRAVIMMTHAR
jgi:hypothetical protein